MGVINISAFSIMISRFGSEKRGNLESPNKYIPGPGHYSPPPKFADVPKYAYGASPLKIQF